MESVELLEEFEDPVRPLSKLSSVVIRNANNSTSSTIAAMMELPTYSGSNRLKFLWHIESE